MSVQNILWYGNIVVGLALILRLLTSGLARSYRLLLYYMVADALESLVCLPLPPRSDAYAVAYFVGQTAKLFLAILIALEMYWKGLAKHEALARFSQKMVGCAVFFATMLAFAGLVLDPRVPKGQYKVIHYFFAFERTIDWAVLILLILIFCFLAWFPVRVPKNFAVYIGAFMVYFLTHSLGLLMINAWPHLQAQISIGQMGVPLLCVLALALFLSRSGEVATTVTGHRWNPAAMEKLAGDLNAINSRFARMSR